ncbi:hypothetical protein BD410DRAFT_327410 [Rickenella mellea]|uniref:Protein YOP1 n=1 Tax=Rickenella mellea TaxID=50990 RepID=A0A4Y7QK50_9AGAM|nr:hypothetical protein BD410DRAFT_327410 [Rickenella mellea]
MHFALRLVCSAAAFLYPSYASYTTLSQRPPSEEDFELWFMYWSVLGSVLGFVVGVEYVPGWFVFWLPLYYTMKTILYLCLPQTRGSSHIYTGASASTTPPTDQTGEAPPTMRDIVSGPVQLLSGLWRTYGPAAITSSAANPSQATPTTIGGSGAVHPSPVSGGMDSLQSILERRRQLQAELVALDAHISSETSPQTTTPPQLIPVQQGSSSFPNSFRTESDMGIRLRVGSSQAELPSDVDGHDDRPGGSSRHGKEPEQGREYDGIARQVSRTGWFGW